MFITKNATYLHIPKTGGKWIERVLQPLIIDSSRHGVPTKPGNNIIGFVRNPWDWYVSVYVYSFNGSEWHQQQSATVPYYSLIEGRSLIQALGEDKSFDNFIRTITYPTQSFKNRYSAIDNIKKNMLSQDTNKDKLSSFYLKRISDVVNPFSSEYWTKTDLSLYSSQMLMYLEYATTIKKYENLVDEFLNFTKEVGDYSAELEFIVKTTPPINATTNRKAYQTYYTPETRKLVEDSSKYFIDKFNYTFE
jgi:hypothetical protein